MLNKLAQMCKATAVAMLIVTTGGHATLADSWTLDGAASRLAFGSVKKDVIGEVHHFTELSGAVAADGAVSVDIDLTSVETWIDIRNERMNEHVFGGAATARLGAQIDMAALEALGVGDTTVIDLDATLNFLGQDVEVYTELHVARLGEGKVMVTTNDMVYLETVELGIDGAIDKLMELAKLPGITRTVPITLRLIFNLDDQKAEAAPAAPVPTAITNIAFVQATGDAAAGKKVFNKCRSCHQIKEGRNASGPSLFGILDKPAGQADGYAYSKAMADSGLTWDTDTLATFLADPKATVPGNKMSFPGLRKNRDIANLIAYLATL